MNTLEILKYRLQNQLLVNRKNTSPGSIVRHMGAIQAQDYPASLWAIGLRAGNITESEIETAIVEKTMVRTWPMRGTLNFVAPEDIRWMLKLLTPRILSVNAKRLKRDYELDDSVYKNCRNVLYKALQGGKVLARNEIYRILEERGIPVAKSRGLHILWHLSQEGFLCFGPRMNKQPGFVLLDEWIPDSRELTMEESLAEIAIRYFKSRGPATEKDFIWWTGLTQTQARKAIDLAQNQIIRMVTPENIYWIHKDLSEIQFNLSEILLLPAFDEYLIGYADRRHMLGENSLKVVAPNPNGVFLPVIINNGQVLGTWKRTIQKKNVSIELKSIVPFKKDPLDKIHAQAREYARFLGMDLKMKE